MEVAKLINLGYLDVSKNLLSGEISSTLGSCTSLETLRLGNNFFNGAIPSLNFLRGLSELDLVNNSLSGEIPVYLKSFILLQNLNLSFNNFEGVVPTQGAFSKASKISVVGNNKLCGGIAELKLPKCNFKEDENRRSNSALTVALSIPFGLLGLALVGCVLYLCQFRNRRKYTPSNSSKNSLLRVSYQTLVKATDGFSSFNLISVGSFGSVYKGVIDGIIVAVKVLNLLQHGALKSFLFECEALRNIRHRNLVKLITTCSTIDYQGHDFKALVYEFMVNGSLEEWLHPNCNEDLSNEELKKLNLLQRLNIITDVVCALNYLHNHAQSPIVHSDLKPSNILLDKDMTGHVGDFGLAKFLADHATHDLFVNETSSVGIRETIGYTAPGEYALIYS
ncbi:receptor kinase-like protein Xa21 [Camellia sinensis]|uniref:receptor kinase-like protein Xa21 n=1 Tax=Camellia sinensis TaxID=4442 RepID=UPI001035C632|nr:receptor kinase-like protein Xa21 [Camellia sinensis]